MSIDTDAVWREFSGALRSFILSRVRDPHTAEDLLQEVFLKIHSGLANLKSEEGIRSWLYSVARNTFIDHFRKRNREPEVVELSEETPAEPGIEGPTAEDFEPCLRTLMERLPERYRAPLVLTELENRSQKEMSEQLGISLPAAKSRVLRGREQMKEILLECCHFEFDRRGNIEEVRPRSAEAADCFRDIEVTESDRCGGCGG